MSLADFSDKTGKDALIPVIGKKEAATGTGAGDIEKAPFADNVLGTFAAREGIVTESNKESVVPLQAFGAVKGCEVHASLSCRGSFCLGTLGSQKAIGDAVVEKYFFDSI